MLSHHVRGMQGLHSPAVEYSWYKPADHPNHPEQCKGQEEGTVEATLLCVDCRLPTTRVQHPGKGKDPPILPPPIVPRQHKYEHDTSTRTSTGTIRVLLCTVSAQP